MTWPTLRACFALRTKLLKGRLLACARPRVHFAKLIRHRSYPYISHLIFNAGVACFKGIIWSSAVHQLLTDWISAVTAPSFYIQSVGDLSPDRLGWVWQCNVFGHYVLVRIFSNPECLTLIFQQFRALEPMIAKQKAATGARVVWVSSHEASSKLYDPKDWQLVKSENSYGCSKYQINMMALHLDREAVRNQLDGIPTVRHLIAYPGVAGTNIAAAILGTFTSLCMFVTLYIVSRVKYLVTHPLNGHPTRQGSWDPSTIPLPSSRRPYLRFICH